MTIVSNDTQTATQQTGASLGMVVSLNAVRNSTTPLPSGYKKLMGELQEQFAAIDQLQRNKGVATVPAHRPAPVFSNGGKEFRIPPVPKPLRDMIAKQQRALLDAAVTAWSQRPERSEGI